MNTENSATPTLADRIAELEPKLRRISRAYGNDQMDADDIFSEMVLGILTKSSPEHTDAMIITKAKWVAKDHINMLKTYTKYVAPEDIVTGNNDEEDDENAVEFIEFSDSTSTPEDAFIEKETRSELEQAFSGLSIKCQMVVYLLKQGYKPVEIAQKFGVSKSAVSQNMAIIQGFLNTNLA